MHSGNVFKILPIEISLWTGKISDCMAVFLEGHWCACDFTTATKGVCNSEFASPLPISSMHTGANAHWLKHLENEEQEGDGGSHFTQHTRPSHNTGSQFCCVPVCFRRWTKMMQACKIGRVAPLPRQARQFLPCQQLQGVRWGSRGPAKPEAPYS